MATLEAIDLNVTPLKGSDRLTNGDWRTNRDYGVRIEKLELEIEAIEIQEMISGASSTSIPFDPSQPPAGYSLCHNGHCHRSDGALISYEEIQRGTVGAEQWQTRLNIGMGTTIQLSTDRASNRQISACEPHCELSEATWGRAIARLKTLRGEGTIVDLSAQKRLPSPLAWKMELPLTGQSIPLDLTISRRNPPQLKLQIALNPPGDLWDEIEWGSITPTDAQQLENVKDVKEQWLSAIARSPLFTISLK